MEWELTSSPKGPCTTCRCSPVDETDPNHPPLPMIHAVGFDINWGEELYLCLNCVGNIADLVGRPSEKVIEKVKGELTLARKQRDQVREKYDEQKALVDKIREGGKAQKELKAKKAQEL